MIASHDDLILIQSFLQERGIDLALVDEAIEGFVPGVEIKNGTLRVGTNATVDSVLHEAGHLANTPKPFRRLMDGNMAKGIRKMFQSIQAAGLDPEDPLFVGAIQCSDPEASAWAFAAGRSMGFADEITILDSSYDGEGAGIRRALAMSQYAGINGMARTGMCAHGFFAKTMGLPAYPDMIRWTQDGPYPEWQEATGAAPQSAVAGVMPRKPGH